MSIVTSFGKKKKQKTTTQFRISVGNEDNNRERYEVCWVPSFFCSSGVV